jgi:ABC-type uncharacterized transport system permease subunit
MRLEPRAAVPWALSLAAPATAVVVSLALCGLLIAWAGAPVLRAYAQMFQGAAGSLFALTETLARATPLIFTSGISGRKASSISARLPQRCSAPGRSAGCRPGS